MYSMLPKNTSQWKNYFEIMYKQLEEILPFVAFGHNKYELILSEIQKFRKVFTENTTTTTVSFLKSSFLFEFFKTLAALVAYTNQYTAEKFLAYFLTNSLNKQYEELEQIYRSFSKISTSICYPCFNDDSNLYYAHYLDLKFYLEFFQEQISTFNEPIKKKILEKIDDIQLILQDLPLQNEPTAPGLIHHSDFEKFQELGHGTYATVFFAKMKESGSEIALKELKSVQLGARNILSLKRELNALIKLHHPNILEFHGVTVTPPFSIATKYIDGGSLFDRIHKNKENPLSGFEKSKIAVCMARGLEYLALLRFLHRDFKTQNVLLDNDMNAIICDFGISRSIGPKMTYELGTIQYTAPELLSNRGQTYDQGCDMYSFAMVIWEMLAEEIPWTGTRLIQIAAQVLDGQRPILPKDPKNLRTFISQCWIQDPKKRPKFSKIRTLLESGRYCFPNTNHVEFEKWVADTKIEHEAIINQARELAAKEESKLIEKLHLLSPLDPTTTTLLQQLYQIDFPLNIQIFEDLLRFVNQNISIEVQDIAIDLMKTILAREDLTEYIQISVLTDRILSLIDTQPQFVASAFKSFADRIPDVEAVIMTFLSMKHTHLTLELLSAVILPNISQIKPDLVIKAFDELKGSLAVGLFRFMMASFGPLPEFLPVACRSVVYLSLYIKELARLCDTNVEAVRILINTPEANKEGRGSLRQILEVISITILNQSAEVTEKMSLLIYNFLVKNCLKYHQYGPILKLMCICANVGIMRSIISESDIWVLITESIQTHSEGFKDALALIERIPICPIEETKHLVWDTLVDTFVRDHEKEVARTISSILKRTNEFNVDTLLETVECGMQADDDFCIVCLKIARTFAAPGLKALLEKGFINIAIKHIKNKDYLLIKPIGKVLISMKVAISDDLQIDGEFLGIILQFLYDDDTPFYAALPLIAFLANSCKDKDIAVFLFNRFFADYMEQLPFKYTNETRVFDALDFCANTLAQMYPISAA